MAAQFRVIGQMDRMKIARGVYQYTANDEC
jgi:hypothetical protein